MDIRKLPANIYKVYCAYKEEKTYTRKLQLMFDVFGQVIRFFGCVFLSEYMYSDYSDGKVNDSIIGLARPSLGSWHQFVAEYIRFIMPKSSGEKVFDSFIFDVVDCYLDICNTKKFEKSYTGRFRNSSSKQDNAFGEVINLRNAIAHGAIAPTEEEAEELTGIYDQYIEKILRSFYPVFEKYTVARIDEIDDRVISITVYFDLIRYDEKYNDRIPKEYAYDEMIMNEPVSDYLQEGQMCLLSEDGRVLKLAEYLVDIIDETEHEDYYLYDGYGNKRVVYIGMQFKKQIEQYLSAIREKFILKGASTKWNKRSFDFESFLEYLNNLAMFNIHIHERTGKYNGKVYVERECDHLLDDFLESDKTTMVITAEAGVGKTNFLCHSAKKLINKKNVVYFFNGNTLTETQSSNILFHRIQSECLNDKDFSTTYDFLKFIDKNNVNKVPFVIFVDAANEAYDMLGVLQEIDEITTRGDDFSWLKVIVSIRTVSFEILKNRITDDFGKKLPFYTLKDRYYSLVKDNKTIYEVEIEKWNILQVLDAFEKYKKDHKIREDALVFHTMSRDLQTLLQVPLNMGMFFQAQMDMPNAVIETEDDLYRIMENDLGDSLTKSLVILQKRIVNEMIDQKKNELDADIVHKMDDEVASEKASDIRLVLLSPLDRLKDSGIVFEKDEDGFFVVAFVYQKYLEYLIAKRFKSDTPDVNAVIEQMLSAKDWHNLPEMYVACLNFLEKISEDNASKLYYAAKEKGININELQTAIIKLWRRRVLNGHSEEVAGLIGKEGLHEWGLILIRELYINEESKACYQLVDELLKSDSPIAAELYYQRGLYYMKISETDKSEVDFEKCISLSEGELKSRSIVQLAKNHRKKGEVPKAIEILEEFIGTHDEDAPCYPDALIQRGLCSYSDHKLEEALDYYERALEITKRTKDHYVSIYNMLGMSTVHAEMGHLDKCENILSEVLKSSNELGYIDHFADCLNGLSANYVRKKEFNEALKYANQGLIIWEYSDFYTGQAVMYCTIIKALIGLEKTGEIAGYMEKLENVMPKLKETVIIDDYNEVKRMVSAVK